uniref:Protein HGH1 homolog n=1 Tax=Grammatophora oceanica TaxID=210454 RepID=A0A7S1VEA0_9STRA|mmetsp:Transcript_44310/g.65747  ORF Transcript_44310/g.65747 Transcript_44310/m.65747 type:complete len:342 (+) Transcript_44310:273-1298(+)|eukprot:CAMPEP_0194034040 /NCGR_PEP_ID=MMETSP0009_2-20130614/6460_1 /TAXON_ID=210454 /ORGANISM="Grammatophora oceanica, Strain CCMP 410" /LENGTH=341 /DNA_ID=CAMNT_0038674779 /DNA_START=179 /DNA_END=1204 /DNA_ORIENTATION=+
MVAPDSCTGSYENEATTPRQQEKQMSDNQTRRGGSLFSKLFCTDFDPSAAASYYTEEPTLDDTVPKLLEDVAQTRSKKRRKAALQQLYELTDKDHIANRVPMVCGNTPCNVLDSLASDLSRKDRRMTCLMLNNLSVPVENKSVMVNWENGRLIGALQEVIRKAQPESYLCLLCLQNLSAAEECRAPLLTYVPGAGDRNSVRNMTSLLRTIELLLQSFARYTFVEGRKSVEGEAVRYALGFLRNTTNITKDEHNAELVLATDIPRILLRLLRDSPKPLARWARDSVEDSALIILVNVAHCTGAAQKMSAVGAEPILLALEQRGTGIHSVRASTIRCWLEEHK